MKPQFYVVLILVTAWLGFPRPSGAQGTIAYYQPATPIILWSQGFDEFHPFDFDGDGNRELTFVYNFQSIGIMYGQDTRSLSFMYPFPNNGGVPQPLPAGVLIGPDSGFDQLQWFGGIPGEPFGFYGLVYITSTGVGGQFAGQHAYMGVEFQRAGATHYGWILLQISEDYAAIGAIESWAWETQPGVPIFAGAVPEPSTWVLLGLGALALVWQGRRSN